MIRIEPSLHRLRILAGEGDYHFYRLLKSGRRWFLFAKCLSVTLAYSVGKSSAPSCNTIALLKGENQRRFSSHAASGLRQEVGTFELLSAGPNLSGISRFPRIALRDAAVQTLLLIWLLLSGRRRYLNLYLLGFGQAIKDAITRAGIDHVKTLICFNDQPYDIAAIVQAFNELASKRTIVVQHGLILSENFYFPSVAREFWAWGHLSEVFFRAWNPGSRIVVRGRYLEDGDHKAIKPVLPANERSMRILLAPSFHHVEVKELVRHAVSVLPKEARLAIKFHPATKLRWLLTWWCGRSAPDMAYESAVMEEAATSYDALITKNSTSAIDFLLRGKPVAFLTLRPDAGFPSQQYGLDISNLSSLAEVNRAMTEKNEQRLGFIKESLNV